MKTGVIKIHARVLVYQEYFVDVPEGMTKEEFIKHLKETDPAALNYENDGIEYISDTEQVVEVDYFDNDEEFFDDNIGSHECETENIYYILVGEPAVRKIEEDGFDSFYKDLNRFMGDFNIIRYNPYFDSLFDLLDDFVCSENYYSLTREQYNKIVGE